MKSFLTGFLLFFFTQISLAQFQANKGKDSHTRFGVKIGYAEFSLYGTDLEEIAVNGKTSSFKNPFIGISLSNPLNSFLILKHEISFIKKGAKIDRLQEETGLHYKSTLNLSYIEIMPISVAVHVKGFQLYTGPYVGTLLHSSIKKQNKDGSFYKDKRIYGDAKQEAGYMQKTDFGYTAGIEYQSPYGFNIGLRLSKGLTGLFEDTENQDSQWNIKNQGFLIHLGYQP